MGTDSFISETRKASLSSILGDRAVGGATPWGIHRWRDFLRCPRRYYLRHVCRLVPEGDVSDSIEFGALMHEMLAHYYRREKSWWILDAMNEEGYKPELQEEAARVFHAYTLYYPKGEDIYYTNVRYKSWIERYVEIIPPGASDDPFDYPAGGLTTRIDIIYEDNGLLVLVDHKTSRAMTSHLTSGFMYDPQMIGIMAGAIKDKKLMQRGRPLGVEINAIVNTKVPQFTRVRHVFDESMIERFFDDFDKWRHLLHQCHEKEEWPRTYACVDKYRKTCEYRDACMNDNTAGLVEAEEGRIL